MQIKQQALSQHLQRKIAPLYMLSGDDNYLLGESLNKIKDAIKAISAYEEQIISIQNPEDWLRVHEEACSYSLFAETVLLSIFYDKKTMDATGKSVLIDYLGSINSRCFIIISAPNIPAKQLQWLSSHEQVTHVIAYPLNASEIKTWVSNQLKTHLFQFSPQIPELIHQYTQGNMLACAQVIEKINLSYPAHSQITVDQVLEHLSNQCEHSLFELVDSCLTGQADKTIQIVKHAANNKTEAILVLWMLTQELRNLLNLFHLTKQSIEFKSACTQLKIWPQRAPLYQSCMKRTNVVLLNQLLHYCHSIDEQIKSNLNTQVWNALERLALCLCLGKELGDAWSA